MQNATPPTPTPTALPKNLQVIEVEAFQSKRLWEHVRQCPGRVASHKHPTKGMRKVLPRILGIPGHGKRIP